MYSEDKLISPKVKEVLLILGIIGLVSASIILPNLSMAIKPILDAKRKKEIEKQKKLWKKYNPYVLRQTLKRLQGQKDVEVVYEEDEPVVRLTEAGKLKLLKYKLEDLTLEDKRWDGRWRLIVYDVSNQKHLTRDIFRRFLKKMNFLQLQKSVYLTPFRCDQEIEYLRQYLGIGDNVLYLVVERIENDLGYKQYFGL